MEQLRQCRQERRPLQRTLHPRYSCDHWTGIRTGTRRVPTPQKFRPSGRTQVNWEATGNLSESHSNSQNPPHPNSAKVPHCGLVMSRSGVRIASPAPNLPPFFASRCRGDFRFGVPVLNSRPLQRSALVPGGRPTISRFGLHSVEQILCEGLRRGGNRFRRLEPGHSGGSQRTTNSTRLPEERSKIAQSLKCRHVGNGTFFECHLLRTASSSISTFSHSGYRPQGHGRT